MNRVLDLEDFDERANDVSNYLCFLRDLEQEKILLSQDGVISKIDTELDKSLKATGFLLLYNLVESTMRNAIQSIFDEMSDKGVAFNQLRIEIKKIILQNVKKNVQECGVNNVVEKIGNIFNDIIESGFNQDELFSGNVDAKEIKKIAKQYGFSATTDIDTRDGFDLLSIKEHRNDLAHGVMSFKEVGKTTSAKNLVEISERVIKYLRQILENIDEYLVNQEYLDSE
ncbi:MAE_28990/MAE_18760 family HEPN-like nuclease [Anabaena sp. UHCC 0451]|uniref:MAE_28990/MAE_18760 family HEPN-like nuclease n=1 Tax=Anabaena sp. UHCC 0451 TaxID=2055235 RepID=UPI002B1F4C36|nr:MAE_28990/MAE_18760 family HEPN-like nuclease [Anabaena sp. UHCC 0451]MEA5577474.1 MAE_28990/MAE_18760 family HEPN-like nuclease [Anabaena sp. UHCC 0451]